MNLINFKPLLAILLLLSTAGCGNTSAETHNSPTPPSTSKKIEKIKPDTVKKEKPQPDFITYYNVAEKLTEYGKNNPETRVRLKTNYGNMVFKLYSETPLHRANFVMLAKRHYFDSSKFYRIINNFMIQGGNSDDDAITHKMMEIGRYQIPPEINSNLAHVKGALALAVSPEEQAGQKRSSPFNFYIIEGQKLSKKYLEEIKNRGIKITPHNYNRYLEQGGAPHLDGNYTVFGQLISGFNTLDKISNLPTDESDWPKKTVYILGAEVME